jgi:ABC-2 type transport system ATP-binding protein
MTSSTCAQPCLVLYLTCPVCDVSASLQLTRLKTGIASPQGTQVTAIDSFRLAARPYGHKQVETLHRSYEMADSSGVLVQIKDITKSYKGGIKALNGISLDVQPGEIFGLIGPNGAGKTTLIGCILGLLTPDSGSVSICGKPPDFLSVRKITGYVPERPDFEYWMTARQFLLYHHGLANGNPKTANRDVDEALELVELQQNAWNRRLKTYSRGMLQRLNLAQLVIGKPKLMLLDEPTLGLDPTGVTVVRNIVESMRASGATAIINSHQLDEIERLCDRVAFIRQGRIGSIETLRAGEICDYILFVKWTEQALNGQLEHCLRSACLVAAASLSEHQDDWARFVVPDKRAAAVLIKELIAAGLPIEEAVPERMRLEQLFSSVDSADSGANG